MMIEGREYIKYDGYYERIEIRPSGHVDIFIVTNPDNPDYSYTRFPFMPPPWQHKKNVESVLARVNGDTDSPKINRPQLKLVS